MLEGRVSFASLLLRVGLKLTWSAGGAPDAVDGLPRVHGKGLAHLLRHMAPGDALLVGNNGGLSHVMLVAGRDLAIHSMATEKTMRGRLGSLVDALLRPWWWLVGRQERTGVIEEPFTAFFDRYERDTWVLLRRPGLTEDEVRRGLARVRALVGRPYDYGFDARNELYYCTEIVGEFLDAATCRPLSRQVPTRRIHVPFLLDTEVIEPLSLWRSGTMVAVLANEAAIAAHRMLLDGVPIANEPDRAVHRQA